VGAIGRSPLSRASRLETSKTQTEASADSKAFVTLRFVGDDLDPDEISALLPVKPTRAHRKGEEFFAGPSVGNLRGRTGIWFLATDKLVPGDDLQDHLAFVRELLSPGRVIPVGSPISAISWSARIPAPT
jgi:hypothetical protein